MAKAWPAKAGQGVIQRARRFFTGGGPLENLAKTGATLALMLAMVVLANITCAAQDWLWFSKEFETRPSRVVIYNTGQIAEYQAGDPGYDGLAEAVRASLASGVVRQSGIGLSPESLDDAYNRYLSVEAFFDGPVKLHAGFDTGHPTQMLFLLTGRHSDIPLVFLGDNGKYGARTPELVTLDPLRQAVEALGY